MNPYLFLYLLFCVIPVFHGDLDLRIEAATTAIEADQKNDSLYIVRGTLYYQHQEFLKSIRDFEMVESLSGSSVVVFMSYAKAWHKLEKLDFAIENVDEALQINDKNAVAYRLKALILMDKGLYQEAANNFELSLNHTDKLITESFLEIALALDSAGTTESIEQSIHILNRGRSELADLEIYKNMIVDQYAKLKDYDSAIQVQTAIINDSNRKERHYYKRAQLYLLSKNNDLANIDIKNAYDAMSNLPLRYIRSKPMDELRNHLIQLSQKTTSE